MFYEDDYVETPACAKCGETCTTGIFDMCLLRAVDEHEVMPSQQNDEGLLQHDIGNFYLCLQYAL